MSPTLLALLIHVPVVTAWIGFVMVDVFAAGAPGFNVGQRVKLLLWSRPWVIVGIVLIMITGVRQTMDNPFLQVTNWATLQELKERDYGLALFWKHGFVLATFGLTLLVRFILAPRLTASVKLANGGEAAAAAPALRLILWLSLANLFFCLLALLATTRMLWTLH